MKELLIANNPDPDSALGYLLWVPLGDGIVLRTAGTWLRTKALYHGSRRAESNRRHEAWRNAIEAPILLSRRPT